MSYRILRRLAEGGFSEVFEVEDPKSVLGEVLVLKRLHPEMSAKPEVRRVFSREGQTLRGLSHPDVVAFRRCFFDEAGRICLLMEKVEGETLDAWSRRNQQDPEAHLRIFGQILEAVDHLHHRPRPLLHLDLKPDNVLVRKTPGGERPTLIDFGIARGLGEGGLKAFSESFSAPEQSRGEALGCYSDVYALGQILATLLDRVENGLAPQRRHALRSVVARATRPTPRQRYADAAQMHRAFRSARSRMGGARDTATGSRRWPVAAALGVVLLAAGGWLLAGGAEKPELVASPPAVERQAVVARFHQSLESALNSRHHAAVEEYFAAARRSLESPHLSTAARGRLQRALAEVRRVVNRPALSDAQRAQTSRWLSEQVSLVSNPEVTP